ncbi:hypothetical protein JCM6882_002944 [Rhodosporidiobolus microsporus]
MRFKFNRSKSSLSGNGSSSPCASPPLTPSGSSVSDPSISSGEYFGGRLVRVPGDPFEAMPSTPSFSFFSAADDGPAFGNFAGSAQLRVLIVGTGFAGLSAAIACARQGFAVTIFERTAGFSVHGDSLILGCNASLLLHRWGIGREMYERSGSKGAWQFKDQKGNVVHEEDLSGFTRAYGAPLLQGRRATFLGSLGTEARLLGVSIRLEAEVIEYYDSPDEPSVILRTGEMVRGDVIIVADGVHSPARDLLAPHDRPPPTKRPSGYSIHRAAVSAAAIRDDPLCRHVLDGTIRTWLGEDAHCCTYPMDNGRSLAMTFTHRDPSTTSSFNWRDKRSVEDLMAHVGPEWDSVLLAVLKHFPSVLHWPVLEETPAEEWISRGGKICFVGDAIHAMQPTSFQGGSQAVEDGATVALCLAMAGGDSAGVELALQAFESLRRPRVGETQKLGAKQQTIWHRFASSSSASSSPASPVKLQPSSPVSPDDPVPEYSFLSLDPTPSPSAPSAPPSLSRSLSRSTSSSALKPLHAPHHFPSPPPASTQKAHNPSLRPLSFNLYSFDCESHTLANFPSFAAAIDPSFRVRERWITEAAKKAGLDVHPLKNGGGGGKSSGGGGAVKTKMVPRDAANSRPSTAPSTLRVRTVVR